MTDPFRTPEDYELFIYTLRDHFSGIQHSNLAFVRKGSTLAKISGEIHFENGFRLVVLERVLFNRLPLIIDSYGYEIWKGNEKLCWYDSQPHPHIESLRATHPHHKHVLPSPKQNRIPAPEMSFAKPNLSFLIQEINQMK